MSFNLQSLTNLNPINAIIDTVADAVGLPPEAKAIAKVGIGFVTSNPMVMLDGVMELGESVQKTASTEWKTSSSASRASDGYAKGGGTQAKPSAPRGNEADCDAYVPGPSTHASSASSSAARTGSSTLSASEAELYRHAKTVYDNFDKIETAGWLKIRDGRLMTWDFHAVMSDPNVPREVRAAAEYFLHNPKALGKIFSDAGPEVDKAKLAQLVIDGEKLGAYGPQAPSNRPAIGFGGIGDAVRELDRQRGVGRGANGPGGPGGTGGPDRSRGPRQTQPPAGIAVGGCHPNANPVRDILNDPSLSPNEKLEAILFSIADAADDEALEIAEQISNLQDQQAGLDRSSKEGQQSAQDMQQDIDRLSQRLQKLMERRTQMMQLISNINKAMHENAMLCISNLR